MTIFPIVGDKHDSDCTEISLYLFTRTSGGRIYDFVSLLCVCSSKRNCCTTLNVAKRQDRLGNKKTKSVKNEKNVPIDKRFSEKRHELLF